MDTKDLITFWDDEFLLKKIAEKYPKGKLCVRNQAGSISLYGISKNWPALVQQRIRCFKNGAHIQSVTHSFAAIFSFLVQLVLVSIISAPFSREPPEDCLLDRLDYEDFSQETKCAS